MNSTHLCHSNHSAKGKSFPLKYSQSMVFGGMILLEEILSSIPLSFGVLIPFSFDDLLLSSLIFNPVTISFFDFSLDFVLVFFFLWAISLDEEEADHFPIVQFGWWKVVCFRFTEKGESDVMVVLWRRWLKLKNYDMSDLEKVGTVTKRGHKKLKKRWAVINEKLWPLK